MSVEFEIEADRVVFSWSSVQVENVRYWVEVEAPEGER